MAGPTGFEIDAFLERPLSAHVATAGPTIRPMWFLWEDHRFWLMTGPWAKLLGHLRSDPATAISVESCDLTTGIVRSVVARGQAELVPFDLARGTRLLSRYLGPDESRWEPRFRAYLHDDPSERGTTWARVRPDILVANDLSYEV
jgi:nitroimidazol reductase NimA-like FMN-containing flavoprotein (pyridoxamine 5'-phosphate oxidase superfamily)